MREKTLETIVIEAVINRVDEYGGNRARAAKSLGLAPRALRYRLIRYEEMGYKPLFPPRTGRHWEGRGKVR